MGGTRDIGALLERFEEGKTVAAARLITILEEGGDGAEQVMDAVFSRTSGAYRVGFTGPPGAGKSTLVYRLSKLFRQKEHEIGIIAVDPTSPFSGGALLGDRIRMQKLSEDPKIFVRSLASRGSLGGISNCTDEVADLLDAFGKDLILIETVGVGQSELEIAEKSHTVVVILVPESGDGIQAMKAGLMEIGDIFVMNKADHPYADLAAKEIEDSLRLKDVPEGNWQPPVLLTSALEESGMEDVIREIENHRRWLEERNLLEEKRRLILRSRVRDAFMNKLEWKLWHSSNVARIMESRIGEVYDGRLSPYRMVEELERLVRIG
jgi:LAO/AO transport system kinase